MGGRERGEDEDSNRKKANTKPIGIRLLFVLMLYTKFQVLAQVVL